MISYFKYTKGNAFTLSGADYYGMINVRNGAAYTGSVFNTQSMPLSAKSTFLAGALLNKLDFNKTINTASLSLNSPQIYPRSILTEPLINDTLNKINYNNLAIFASEVVYNQNFFNILSRTLNELPLTYSLSAIGDEFTGKLIPKFRIPYSDFTNVRGSTAKTSSIFVATSGNSYKYFNNNHVLYGVIGSSNTPTIETGIDALGFTHTQLHYDKYNNLLYNTQDNKFRVYNFNYDSACLIPTLNDDITLSYLNTVTNSNHCVYGKKYRSVIVLAQGELNIEIYNVHDVRLLKTIKPIDIGLDNVITLCQRFEDDILCVYGIKDDEYWMCIFDISDLLQSNYKAIHTNSIIGGKTDTLLEFATFDSDIIFFKRYNDDGTLLSFEFRSISNSKYPIVSFTPDQAYQTGFLSVFEQIDLLDQAIETIDIPLGIKNLASNKPVIYDIKFDVNNTINSIITFSDSFTIINNNVYNTITPLDTQKLFSYQPTSNNSIGLTLNDAVRNVLYDTLILYTHTTQQYQYDPVTFQYIYSYPTKLQDINITNTSIYENESVNTGVLNRILNEITQTQEKLVTALDTQL